MKLGIGIGITGHVVAERIKPDGTVVERREFDNVILNSGWEHMKTLFNTAPQPGLLYPRYLYLGTGTVEPSAEDTGLQSISGTLGSKLVTTVLWPTGSGFVAADKKSGWTDVQLRFDYGQGVAAGTWTELGLAYQDTYTTPLNRALFRDQDGAPISLTVLNDEYFRVTVTLRMYIRLQDGTLTFTFNGAETTTSPELSANGITSVQSAYSWWRRWPSLATFNGTNSPVSINNGRGVTRSGDIALSKASFVFYEDYLGANLSYIRLYFYHNAASVPQITCLLSPTMVKLDGYIMEGTFSIQFFRDCVEMAAGTATSGTTTTLTDTTKTWTVDEFKNKRLLITGGAGEGETLRIDSNTVDTLTFAVASPVAIDNTSTYRICSNG